MFCARLIRRWFQAAFILASFAGVAAAATNSPWLTRAWQTEEGLPNTYVDSVAQDQDGYLWVATPVTLAKFDGVHFTKFPFRNPAESEYQGARRNQGARKVIASRTGGLWITPINGQAVYLSPDHSQLYSPTTGLSSSTSPYTSFEDNDGNFWFAAGGGIVRLKNGKPTQFGEEEGVPKGAAFTLASDAAGNVWLVKGSKSTGSSVLVFNHERFEPVTTINGLARLAGSRSGGVWIANREHLFKCDLNGSLQDFGSFQPNSPSTDIREVMEDRAGGVWIGTEGNGLFRHGQSGFEKVETSYPVILSLMQDRENNLWVGTGGGGLDRISPRVLQIEGVDEGFSLVGIQSLCEDIHGLLWGAAQNGLLVCRSNGTWRTPFTNAIGRASCVASDSKGALWIGTQDGTLHCWSNNKLTTWDSSNGLACNAIFNLLASSSGDLWLAEFIPNCVQCLHEGKLRSLTFSDDIGRINAMAEDTTGNIWIGTSKGLLLRAEDDHLVDETRRTSESGRAIRSLYTTPDGTLWIGYSGWGLGRLKEHQFDDLNTDQGLPDDYISQMIADDQGWFWFGSAEHGIFKIPQKELDHVMDNQSARLRPVLYGRNEGLLGMEVFGYSPGAIRSRDGLLWIPMRKGLAVVNPKILHENPEPPKVILTRVVLDNQIIASYGGIAFTQQLANLKTLETPLRLPPGHRRLEIDFTAFNFNAPENVHLQYRLDGADNDWVDAEPERRASYSRLAARDYTFRVRACNADGLWNQAGTPLAFIVDPFFWQTWSFRIGGLVLFTSAVIAAVRYVSFRRVRLKLQTLEQQAVLDKERTRIARDLHDDLGCSLTHVALLLEMNEQAAAAHQTNGKTQLCSPMVRQVVKSVDEIVWAINPRNDRLQYLLDYIVEFSVDFLHAAGICPQVDLPERIPERAISPEVRHHVFLVVKEALNNIVRHAQPSETSFRITLSDDQLVIVIEDNGRGFERPPDSVSADGLRNMRQRMEEIGGRLQIESKPGAGTKVSLFYHWPHDNGSPGFA